MVRNLDEASGAKPSTQRSCGVFAADDSHFLKLERYACTVNILGLGLGIDVV